MYNLLQIGSPTSAHLPLQTELTNRYTLKGTDNISSAMSIIRTLQPDLILLSSNIPNGLQIIGQLKMLNDAHDIPIIYLTETDSEDERIAVLTAGADDCLTNIYSPRESAARIEARLRNRNKTIKQRIEYDIFCLDPESFTLIIHNTSVHITITEFRLFKFFLNNPGKALTRKQILNGVWDEGSRIDERTIDANIRRLRHILSRHNCDGYIQTVHGIGYRFWKPLEAI